MREKREEEERRGGREGEEAERRPEKGRKVKTVNEGRNVKIEKQQKLAKRQTIKNKQH